MDLNRCGGGEGSVMATGNDEADDQHHTNNNIWEKRHQISTIFHHLNVFSSSFVDDVKFSTYIVVYMYLRTLRSIQHSSSSQQTPSLSIRSDGLMAGSPTG